MMQWKTVLAQGALAGSLASLLSNAVLAIVGRRQTSSPLVGFYAAFTAGLAAGALALRDQYREKNKAEKQQADAVLPVVRRVRAGHI